MFKFEFNSPGCAIAAAFVVAFIVLAVFAGADIAVALGLLP